jgi:hypothetical protein
MAENLPTPGKFVGPTLKTLFNESIDQLLADLGREITLFFTPSASGCPNCFSAPDGNSNGVYDSNNPFGLGQFNKPFPDGTKCPVCQGSHKILTTQSANYTALLGRNPEDIDVTQFGLQPTNVMRTKTQVVAFHDIKRAEKALIEGEIYVRLRDPVLAGLAPPQFTKTFWVKQD